MKVNSKLTKDYRYLENEDKIISSDCTGGILMLGRRINRLRNERGLSQKQLAERLGVRKQTVSNWENDNAMPSMDKFLAMVEFFHTTPNFMLGYETKAGIDVAGLSENEVEHVAWIINDYKALHEKAEQ